MADAVPRRIVVGVTGGIAAYKAVGVVRQLVLAGHEVTVIPTESALRFVGRPTWEAISRRPVETELFEGVAQVRHVAIGQAAELIVIAPATADALARLATGLAGDLLGTTVLASTAPLVIAPAMHTEMWNHPATRHNVEVLRERGATIVGPASGQLTGADAGVGRMSEPDEIVAAALAVLGAAEPTTGDLAGRRILVSAGGTREPIDPVRFVGNRSSGRQGVELAAAAARRGADVVLVAANLDAAILDALRADARPAGVRVVPVGTAEELDAAMVREAAEADLVVMAAAVADYRPESVSERKLKKEEVGDDLALRLVRTPDILAELSRTRREGQVVVGFAAETERDPERLLAIARAKALRKGVDLLVVNRVGWSEGIGTADNAVTVISGDGRVLAEAAGSKATVADRILDLLA